MTSGQRPPTWLLGLSVLSLVALAFRAVIHLVSYNYNLAAEANGLFGILSLYDGKPLYPQTTEKPYYLYLYPPFHAWVGATLLRGLPPLGLHGKVIALRLFSFVSFGASLFLFHRFIVKPFRIPFVFFLLAGTMGLSKFADYVTTTRNDMFYLLLWVAALCFFLTFWRDPKKKPALVLFLVFSVMAFTVRPSALAPFGAILFFCFWKKKGTWLGYALGAGYLLCLSIFSMGMSVYTHGAFLDHVFYANLRPFRSLDFNLFDRSLVSFLITYAAFFFFSMSGLVASQEAGPESATQSERQLLFCLMVANVGFGLVAFLRAGGDVNYFFDSLFLSVAFCAIGLQSLAPSRWVTMALAVECLLIIALFTVKARSAYRDAFLPYQKLSDEIKSTLPKYIELVGARAPNLTVYLRGLAFHGPDVTTGSFIALNSHAPLRWILRDLTASTRDGTIKAYVVAETDCAIEERQLPSPFSRYHRLTNLESWLCVYVP